MANARFSALLPALLLLFSCKKDIAEPVVSLHEFKLEPEFRIECVAAEPLIDTPVAIDFDEKGRIWIVEMPGYMPNPEGIGEDEPIGRISILEDRDGDGRMDTRKVFLDGLVMPRALALVYGGLLYCEPPNLFFVEIDGDKPGQRILVDSTYAPGLNPEYMANGLHYNLDNWIYSAGSNKKYRLRNGQWETSTTVHRGQWGITHDADGRLLYNNNSLLLLGDHLPPNLLEADPKNPPHLAQNRMLTTDQRVWPAHPTLVNRGYQVDMLDSLGRVRNTTSACGPTIYLGDQFPPVFWGNAFVCVPEGNLLKRLILEETGNGQLSARQATAGSEFLTSTDATFRPVNLTTGLDGALYMVDMRRGLIQHQAYLSQYLKQESKKVGLDTMLGRGRIYRIAFGTEKTAQIDLSTASNSELWELLGHENGYIRLKAQQMLIQKDDAATIEELERMAAHARYDWASLHALWTLEGMGKLTDELLVDVLQNAGHRREAGLAILATYSPSNGLALKPAVEKLVFKGSLTKTEGLHLYAVLGRLSYFSEGEKMELLQPILSNEYADSLTLELVARSLSGQEAFAREFMTQRKIHNPLVSRLLKQAMEEKTPPAKASAPLFANTDERTSGLHLYRQYCAACHRPNGEGTPNLAPPLVGSTVVNGSESALSKTIWEGKNSGAVVNGQLVWFNEPMAAFKENPAWDEKMLKAVTAYVRNAFGEEN